MLVSQSQSQSLSSLSQGYRVNLLPVVFVHLSLLMPFHFVYHGLFWSFPPFHPSAYGLTKPTTLTVPSYCFFEQKPTNSTYHPFTARSCCHLYGCTSLLKIVVSHSEIYAHYSKLCCAAHCHSRTRLRCSVQNLQKG